MNHRLPRVREIIQRELGSLIERELTFGGSLVTVNHVDITPDLRQCHVFVSVIGPEGAKEEALRVLAGARRMLQSAMSKRVILKYTPRLHFKLDESVERGVRVTELLNQLDIPADPPTPHDEDPD